jgi:hypothetical protein
MRQQRKSDGEGVKRLTGRTSRMKAIVRGSLATDHRSDPVHGNGAPSRCRSEVLIATLSPRGRAGHRAFATTSRLAWPITPITRFSIALALTLALAVAAMFVLAASPALAGVAHEFTSSFGPDCTEASLFEKAGTVAVDQQSHDIYAAQIGTGTVVRCAANGTPDDFTAGPGAGTNEIGGFEFLRLQGATQIAIDPISHDFYVAPGEEGSKIRAFAQDGAPAEFTAGPNKGSNEIASFAGISINAAHGVAVDSRGTIYVANRSSGAVDIYEPSGEELTSFAVTEPANLAIDSHGAVYVSGDALGAKGVTKFLPSAFPVTAATTYSSGVAVDPEATFAITVDPLNDDLYAVEHLDLFNSQVAQFDKDGKPLGVFAKPGEPGPLSYSEGIALDGASGNVYVSDARGEHQVVRIFSPSPPLPPQVESTSASGATSTSVNFSAVVSPKHFDTHYHFQYVAQTQFEATGFAGAGETPEVDLGSSGTPQGAHGFADGLTPDTAYRFRVIAVNENGQAASAEPVAFSTFAAFAPGLPDGRAYELVSPPQKTGEVFAPSFESLGGSCVECLPGSGLLQSMPMQSSPDGEHIAYEGQPFSVGVASGPNEYLAQRAPSGWETQGLSSSLFSSGFPEGYVSFSADLSRSVISQFEPALSPDAPTRAGKSFSNLYLRDEGGALQPLVTKEPEHRSPGKYNAAEPATENNFDTVFAGANSGTAAVPAFSHIVFEANDALTAVNPPNAPAAPIVAAAESDLYEWVGGQLGLVNVLPGNTTSVPGAVIGSGHLAPSAEPQLEPSDFDHAISADGSRIFWSDGTTGQVYVRIDGRETREIKDPSGKFLSAATDGSKVLLSDGCLYDLDTEACQDLTGGQEGFEGTLGASEDMSRLYFVDSKILLGAKENANKEAASDGAFNLYAWHQGAVTFIGRLEGSGLTLGDNLVGLRRNYGDWRPSSSNRTAQVSPDGTHLAFMSRAGLTGYDNKAEHSVRCGVNGSGENVPCFEVFEYDSSSGRLTCASCNPTGVKPLGPSNLSLIEAIGLNVARLQVAHRQPGNLSADGRLFFESQDVLSPHDTNGDIQDVYEWEPSGAGSCKRGAGCILLISSGHSPNDSMFVDATPSGNDAFFITREQLLSQDKNDQLDLYDARVGGGIFGGDKTAPCSGEACKGALAAAPPSSPPGSSVFSGLGNLTISTAPPKPGNSKPLTRAQKLAKALKACTKKPKRKRRACRAQARKRYGSSAKIKSKTHRGVK